MLDLGFIHALKRIVALGPAQAPDPVLLGHHAEGDQGTCRQISDQPGRSVGDADRDHGRADRTERDDGQPGRKARASGDGPQGRRRSSARWSSAAPSMAPTRSSACSKRPASPPARSTATRARPQRERAIAAFKSGDMPVLIATDIAARGIDIPGVSHVVNFDLPDVPEQYVHRIGRTARAGADGIAIAFCSHDERGNLRDIERTTRQKIAGGAAARRLHGAGRSVQAPEARAQGAAGARASARHTKADRRHDGQQRRESQRRTATPWRSVPKDMPPIARTRRIATGSAATIVRRRAPKAPAARAVRPTGRKRIARLRPNRVPQRVKAVSVPRAASPSANSTAAASSRQRRPPRRLISLSYRAQASAWLRMRAALPASCSSWSPSASPARTCRCQLC